ncbi:MAG: hypothetical protein OEW75_04055 [Cyclobacteriaceae bacterium]|nr:hypothetical protein [Cyclobacteriaceae bacterium]
MSLVESRYAIVEELSAMDVVQTQKVLEYISNLKNVENGTGSYSHFKEQALAEIHAALLEA